MARERPAGRTAVSRGVEDLHPGYFAAVMSTGIISVAFEGLGFASIGYALFVLNLGTYVVLTGMLAVRSLAFTEAVVRDLRDPGRCWGFFTFVVGTNTVGSQLVVFQDHVALARVLWLVGLVSWVGLTYAIYTHLFAAFSGPVEDAVSGATLLTVVGTQSVAVLGSQLAHAFGPYSDVVRLFALTHFAAGWVLYLVLVALVVYRLLLVPLEPADWTGPYWICMGAVAITTLAGSNMLLYLDMRDLAGPTLTFTYVAWAVGAWWIPILLALDVWKLTRYDISGTVPGWVRAVPWLRLALGDERRHVYEPASWGRVFPMGMFTAATIALTEASNFEMLRLIPSIWGWFALVVWALTAVGTGRAVLGSLRG